MTNVGRLVLGLDVDTENAFPNLGIRGSGPTAGGEQNEVAFNTLRRIKRVVSKQSREGREQNGEERQMGSVSELPPANAPSPSTKEPEPAWAGSGARSLL